VAVIKVASVKSRNNALLSIGQFGAPLNPHWGATDDVPPVSNRRPTRFVARATIAMAQLGGPD